MGYFYVAAHSFQFRAIPFRPNPMIEPIIPAISVPIAVFEPVSDCV